MHPFEQQREEGDCAEVDATDAARARALELGIGVEVVTGTGSNGRVTRDDVEAHAEKLRAKSDAQGDDLDPTGEQGAEPHEDQSRALPETENPVTERAPAPVRPKNGDGCVCFRCPTNPRFNLSSHQLGTIHFTDGCYETSDPTEIAALRACQFVEEVSG